MQEALFSRDGIERAASISDCGRYRYLLTQHWAQPVTGPANRRAIWIMLNPSTADAFKDDATIRKCRAFAKTLGCAAMSVCNLFAYRATEPKDLAKVAAGPYGVEAIGPECDQTLERVLEAAVHGSTLVIAGWGVPPAGMVTIHRERAAAVHALVKKKGHTVMTMKRTLWGYPSHPLYLSMASTPKPYELPLPEPKGG